MSKKKTILVVDDESDNIKVIVDYLMLEGDHFRMLQALNSKKALKITKKEFPDLIITDWDMPDMSGIELIKKVRSHEKIKNTPIVMCTGIMTSPKNLKTALEAGATDYVKKPVDPVELLARVTNALNLAERYNEISTLNDSKDQIFSVIAHDLKGPVANMALLAEMMYDQKEEMKEEEVFKISELMKKQSVSTLGVLDNLFSWANGQKNSVSYSPKINLLVPVIRKVMDFLEPSIEKKKIKVDVKVNCGIKAFFDIDLISTVIRNLLTNAIKFTPIGGNVEIRASIIGDFIHLAIIDNGLGMTQNQIDVIYNPALHKSTTGTDGEQGSGLGTKICVDFLKRHKSELAIKSKPGKGSEFSFLLPLNS
ncbi:MAG: hybrid sensor histidine kinase/response regulator [Cyclobacteriaceae bacterium]|nr:hybrid sensor histidine kinase/response regulator [Cyclobacteriaceae bacterium]